LAVGEAEELPSEADGKHLHPHAVAPGHPEMAVLVYEDEQAQHHQEVGRVEEAGSDHVHREDPKS
jgi:hypothetical protein